MTWIKHFAIKSRARGLQGILEQINPCTTLLLHRLFSPVSLSASWLQTSLDYTQSHQSCFRCWNEPNTHHLLPLRLILASPSFPFAPSPALYICRRKKREKAPFSLSFSQGCWTKPFIPTGPLKMCHGYPPHLDGLPTSLLKVFFPFPQYILMTKLRFIKSIDKWVNYPVLRSRKILICPD